MPPAGPVNPAPHLARGQAGEDAAAAHLRRAGYAILARNWRVRSLELDLVCRDGQTVVFVEVKTRGPGSLATPAEGLSPAKMNRLARAAAHWLSAHDAWDRPCRFDLVAVREENGRLAVEHEQDVFDLSQALPRQGGWQPW